MAINNDYRDREFEFYIASGQLSEKSAKAICFVGDTMFLAKMWLRQNQLPETVESMARFTEMVLRYKVEDGLDDHQED